MLFKIILLAVALGVTSASSLGKTLVRRSSLPSSGGQVGIYDGSNTTIEQHPYLASVIQAGPKVWSAGTIVSKSWIILSADSAYGFEAEDLSVVVGSQDGTTGKTYAVKKIVLHPKYTSYSLDYDVAAIQIKGSFKFSSKVKAVKLPKQAAKVNSNMVVAGYGATMPYQMDYQLLSGNMKWLSKKTCAQWYKGSKLPWTPRMGCTYNKGKTTCCDGDWSDPFVQDGTLYGLFLTGSIQGWCTGDAYPNIVTDVLAVTPWIQKTIAGHTDHRHLTE